jgi:hypothetical protein
LSDRNADRCGLSPIGRGDRGCARCLGSYLVPTIRRVLARFYSGHRHIIRDPYNSCYVNLWNLRKCAITVDGGGYEGRPLSNRQGGS